jgi:hypothetical protein
MSPMELYLLIKLDAIILLARWFMTPAFAIAMLSLLVWLFLWVMPYGGNEFEETQDEVEKLKKQCKRLRQPVFKIFILSMLIWLPFRLIVSLLPSTKEMAIIYVVPKVVNSDAVAQIPGKLLSLSSEWLDELRPENIKDGVKTIVQQSQSKTGE